MAVDLKAEEDAIRQLNQRWFEAEQRKDLEATMSFIAVDAVMQVPNMPQLEGWEAIRNFYIDFFQVLISVTGGPKRIVVSAAGDLAYDIGTTRAVLEGPDGRVEDDGKYLVVWRRLNGEWKGVAFSFSSDKPSQ